MTTYEFTAKRMAQAQERVVKKALRSKRAARALLQQAGIITKSGKLAKPYCQTA